MPAFLHPVVPPVPPADLPDTVGALRRSGYRPRTVKAEVRDNLLAMLREGRDPFPGVVGFEHTVRPQLERALLAGHDLVLLGERGQGKTRLLRTLVGLLDEWSPQLAGSEIHEEPLAPVTTWGLRQVAERGEDAPVTWRHRSERYGEKLATPDTSVGDLIGDVDPVKVAEGRSLGDPETVHYGLVPRTNRGIFAVNELPDLAERIQVSLLNVLEERDVQVRGYALRLPLDLLLVASANPEDYTNRGRIITPLKDRFGAEVRTHYPLRLADEVLFGKLKKGGTVRIGVEKKETGETGLKLETLADETPVKPKKEEPADRPKPARKAPVKKAAAAKAVVKKPDPKGKDGGKRSLVPQLPRKN